MVSDHNTESSFLGAVIDKPTLWSQACELTPDDFSVEPNRIIFRAMNDMFSAGRQVDDVMLAAELARRGQLEHIGGHSYIGELLTGVTQRKDIGPWVASLRRASGLRLLAHTAEAIGQAATGPAADLAVLRGRLVDLADTVSHHENTSQSIRSVMDLPNITSADIQPPEWLIDGLIPRGSLTLWVGTDGCAKSWLALAMADAVASGGAFLGRQCAHSIALYLDYENPDHEIKRRIGKIVDGDNPLLKHWGHWVGVEPPQIGDPLLLNMCEEAQPLLIVDPLRYAHGGDENDSGEMTKVMRHLRSYAAAGATVMLMHHVSKSEGSLGRGSTAIKGACDMAVLQEIGEDGLIRLRVGKNRFGERTTITVAPDFQAGAFELTDSPAKTERRNVVDDICHLIQGTPGLNQTQIIESLKIGRTTGINTLKLYDGKRWESRDGGLHGAVLYYPIPTSPVPVYRPVLGTAGTADSSCTAVPHPIGWYSGTGQETGPLKTTQPLEAGLL
ncbi:MAG TPA: AAA family ATPase [Terriglobales bacterium]